jgi:hypothetical protein
MGAAQTNPAEVGSRLTHSISHQTAAGGDRNSPFYVPTFLHVVGGIVERYTDFWIRLGRLESGMLESQLHSVAVRAPIFICGLARSGSTLLHELIASCPGTATHRMLDYPMVFTPYWWRKAVGNLRAKPPRERVHGDGVMVTPQSPDALEEMIWTAFFPRCHDPSVPNLAPEVGNRPDFETFYRNHVRKLLIAERADRYAAKANYHIARLTYLVRVFPDARFIVPVRAPADHIGSLMRQHHRFCKVQRSHFRLRAFMRRAGHFEFGLDRRPIHLGDGSRVREIQKAWGAGNEVRGWAMYWDMIHGYLDRLLAADARVRRAVKVVRFEDICTEPAPTIAAVLDHCGLPAERESIERHVRSIHLPTTYERAFTGAESARIKAETGKTAGEWGYDAG